MLHGLYAVHDRHAVIHENNIVPGLLRHLNGFLSGGGGVDLNLGPLQEVLYDGQVHFRIVNDQNLRLRRMEGLPGGMLGEGRLLGLLEVVTDRFEGEDLLADGEGEVGPLAVFTLDLEFRPHEFQKMARNRHAQAGAFDISDFLLICPLEGSIDLL